MTSKRGCDSCNRHPTNHGQRDSCWHEDRDDEYSCNEENNYKEYEPLPKNHKHPTWAT